MIVWFCSASPSLALTATTSYSIRQVHSSGALVRCLHQLHSSGAFFRCTRQVPSSAAFVGCLHQLHSSGVLFGCIHQVHSSGAFFRCIRQVHYFTKPASWNYRVDRLINWAQFISCTLSEESSGAIVWCILGCTSDASSAAATTASPVIALSKLHTSVSTPMQLPFLLFYLVKYFISSFRLNKLIITVNYVFHSLCYVNRFGWCTCWVMLYEFMEY